MDTEDQNIDVDLDQLEEVMASGDPEAIDAYLASMESDEGESNTDTDAQADTLSSNEPPAESNDPAPVQALPESTQPVVAPPAPTETPTPDPLLESERAERERLAQENLQLQQQLQGSQKLERQVELLTGQLEGNGLKPEQLPEDFKLTDELKSELLEDYGEQGKALVALYAQMDAMKAAVILPQQNEPDPVAAPQNDADEVMQAISRNPTLDGWRTNEDQSRFSLAVQIDQNLQKDPAFQNATYDERFAEVTRRAQAAFGETPAPQPDLNQVIAEAEKTTQPPVSLTQMGTASTSADQTGVQRLSGMDSGAMADSVMNMNASDLDALFDELDGEL